MNVIPAFSKVSTILANASLRASDRHCSADVMVGSPSTDKLLDAGLEPHLSDHSDLEAEVTQSTAQIVLDCNRLRLQKLAMGQQHSQFLTAERLHMHRAIKSRPYHLGDAARIVAVRLVDLRLQYRLHVSGFNADHRQPGFGQSTEQPLRQRSGF